MPSTLDFNGLPSFEIDASLLKLLLLFVALAFTLLSFCCLLLLLLQFALLSGVWLFLRPGLVCTIHGLVLAESETFGALVVDGFVATIEEEELALLLNASGFDFAFSFFSSLSFSSRWHVATKSASDCGQNESTR
jgi:hypothetical protein